MGRPTKYKADFPDRVRKMVGLTHADMAKNLGIGLSAYCDYMRTYPQFSQAIKEADDVTNSIVESAIYKAAIGYESNNRHYPPNPTLAIFWAKNKMGWRDKQDIEHSGSVSDPVKDKVAQELSKLDADTLMRIAFGSSDIKYN